ncbi:uncharacterized protein LOC110095645 [Dendrobium catenatum]|uniref:uncharacterized protein LOC110095645 n=1 Tax=Dendrobium catenatum TaxID=906689 RepID=UPI0009F2A14E|nr:uncharacterized protein LOC110095645 [Dendrobium catenatum]
MENSVNTVVASDLVAAKIVKETGDPSIQLTNSGKIKLSKELRSLGPMEADQRKRRGKKKSSKMIGGSFPYYYLMASLILWNCRGIRKREASLYLREIVNEYEGFFIGLTKTKLYSLDRCDINMIIGNDWDYFHHPVNSTSGGILVMWKRALASFDVTEHSSQLIMGTHNSNNLGKWNIATVYGGRDVQTCRKLWQDLEGCLIGDNPAIIGGDFNCILSKEDKKGGKRFHFSKGPKEMKMFLTNNDFHDIGFVGPNFTWRNNKEGNSRIWERLDRCFLNSSALHKIPMAKVCHLSRVASDHAPISLNMVEPQILKSKFIRFGDTWKSYPATWNIVLKAWKKADFGSNAEVLQ